MPALTQAIPAGMRHPRVKTYLALKSHTHANPENLACIEGIRMLKLAIKAGIEIESFFVCPEQLRGEQGRSMAETIIAMRVPAYQISEKTLSNLTEWDGPDGLAAIVRLPRADFGTLPLREQNVLLVLDGLQIPGNIGTIIRCADGAGADGVIITNRKQRLTHPKLLRASIGSLFSIPIIETETSEAIAWLKQERFKIITTDTRACQHYRQASYDGRVAVVMGNEHNGISQEWYAAQDSSVVIPMNGRADSLNVANAAVLMLYEVLYQQNR